MSEDLDLLVLGHRIRHARRECSMTLAELGERVGRPAPYLSQLENGKVEPKLSLVTELATALDTSAAELLDPAPPDHRSDLEIRLERAQRSPEFAALGLPEIKPSAKLGAWLTRPVPAAPNRLRPITSASSSAPPS